MLPLILVALGVGAFAVYAWSSHAKTTAEAAIAHQDADAQLAAAAQAMQQADLHAAQQDTAQEAAARQRAAAHAVQARRSNSGAARKVAEAAPVAKTDHQRSITALQADLTEANHVKIVALGTMSQAAELMRTNPVAGKAMLEQAQADYNAAQARSFAAATALRQLGVNPQEIGGPPRTDSSR